MRLIQGPGGQVNVLYGLMGGYAAMHKADDKISISILDTMEDCVYVVREDYTLDYMNRLAKKVFGEKVGDKCYHVINGRDEICQWCKLEEVIHGATIRRELFIPSAQKHYILSEMPLENEDGTLSKLGLLRDVTQRIIIEEKARASEEDYRRLFEHARTGLYLSSKEGRFLDANRYLLDVLGYEEKGEFLSIDITKNLYEKPNRCTKNIGFF
jgi:PAS domain-containing protein